VVSRESGALLTPLKPHLLPLLSSITNTRRRIKASLNLKE
jgi:hypothetical protein